MEIEVELSVPPPEGTAPSVSRPLDPRIAQTVRLMMTSPRRTLSVTLLAKRAALSPSQFAHLFRTQTGWSPGVALRAIRMERAAKLLSTTRLPLKEIAARVGIPSAAALCRSFRARHGITPLEFRRAWTTGRADVGERTVGLP